MNLAELFYLELCKGCDNLGRDYKSAFANQGTPPRQRKPKSGYKPFKLFKGHRP